MLCNDCIYHLHILIRHEKDITICLYHEKRLKLHSNTCDKYSYGQGLIVWARYKNLYTTKLDYKLKTLFNFKPHLRNYNGIKNL